MILVNHKTQNKMDFFFVETIIGLVVNYLL